MRRAAWQVTAAAAAGYVITSYEIQGSKNNKLHGYFKRVIWEGIGSQSSGGASFGARAVSLVE